MNKNWELIKSSLEVKFQNHSVLILGFGKEGMSTYHLLKSLEASFSIYIMDQNNGMVEEFLVKESDKSTVVIPSEDYLNGLDGFDVIFKTPGLPGYFLKDIPLHKITSQSELFMEYLGERCIGITGTKGKSTTSSAITHVLSHCGLKTKLVGNIGFPALESLVDDDGKTIYVYEMSSFQTEFLQVGPRIAVILNLFEEHLNNYMGYEAYQNAKLQLFKSEPKVAGEQLLIYGCDNHVLLEKIIDLRKIQTNKRYFSFGHQLSNALSDPGYYIAGDNIVQQVGENIVIPITSTHFSTKLLGEHNLLNSLVVFIVVDEFIRKGLMSATVEEVIQYLGSFQGLPHRLENIGVFKGINFYNDSISTIPEATIKAIEAIPDLNTLIIGGFDRGINYQPLVDCFTMIEPMVIICLPTTGHKIYDMLIESNSKHTLFKVEDMTEAIKLSYIHTPKGKSCLLSPAASSYNQYKNFEDRGAHFVELVRLGERIEN